MGSIAEAIKGAQIELGKVSGSGAKVVRLLRITRIFATELLGSLAIVPYGVRAMRIHQSLPHTKHSLHTPSISICKDIAYSNRPRTVMDIYIPSQQAVPSQPSHPKGSWQNLPHTDSANRSMGDSAAAHSGNSDSAQKLFPVALFCHGGVWATGSKWHYAPMASQLAKAGILTCVIQYSLYPDALAPQMVDELSQALTWTFNNISKHGGNPDQVSLLGHSAGGQMCAMALLHRAKALSRHTKLERRSNGHQQDWAPAKERMPARFIGIAAVYDIETHYQYEFGRGVAELSTMKRAMGGRHKFQSQSPALILNAACGRKATMQVPDQARGGMMEVTPGSRVWQGRLASLGRAVQSKLPGFMMAPSTSTTDQSQVVAASQANGANIPSAAAKPSSSTPMPPSASFPPPLRTSSSQPQQPASEQRLSLSPSSQQEDLAPGMAASAPASAAAIDDDVHVSLEEAGMLPPVTLMSSTADIIVPWQQSEELYQVLQECKLPVKHRVYNNIPHAAFVIDWSDRQTAAQGSAQQPQGYQTDLIEAIRGCG
ncbi:hypothetical protein WJX77_007852 [Trebouxia sp. C0004]